MYGGCGLILTRLFEFFIFIFIFILFFVFGMGNGPCYLCVVYFDEGQCLSRTLVLSHDLFP